MAPSASRWTARCASVDENGARTPPEEVGRLRDLGSHLLDGYLSDPQATAAVLRDGWLDTGDLFRVDSDGFYVFAGRHKTVIKRGGITVYPEDVRRPLEALAWVREVEVIGVPDPTFEQIVVVCAVLDAGRTAADVHAECARQLAPERRPDRVILMSSLPRGASGKVRREVLLEQAAQPQREIAGDDSIAGQVQAIAAQIFQVDAATLSNDTTPDDVPNWDSYAQIELAMALEKRFDLRLTPKELMQLRSLGHAVENPDQAAHRGPPMKRAAPPAAWAIAADPDLSAVSTPLPSWPSSRRTDRRGRRTTRCRGGSTTSSRWQRPPRPNAA